MAGFGRDACSRLGDLISCCSSSSRDRFSPTAGSFLVVKVGISSSTGTSCLHRVNTGVYSMINEDLCLPAHFGRR